jgi:hypothetical protein
VTTHRQIYRDARHLLGRRADSHVTPNIPGIHELQQEISLAHEAYHEQAKLDKSLQLRLKKLRAPAAAVDSSTPRREKIPNPPKYSGHRSCILSFLIHLLLKLYSYHNLFPDVQKKMVNTIGRLEGSSFNHLLSYANIIQVTRLHLIILVT